jgi:hypothetical protein
MLSDIESDSDDGSNNRAVAPAVQTATSTDGGEEGATTSVTEPTVEVSKASKALIAKMREDAYEARRKKVELQELNLTKMWPYITYQMSPSSLAKVREFPGYEEAKVSRDVVKLWGFIRRSHLTHVHGSSDKLRAVNINDQLRKFNNMRQGDREGTPEIKSRYDNQVKANEGVGVVNDDDSLVAVDFLSKLDPKRFTSLLTALRNNAAIGASSYPTTLTGAYRAASTWTTEGLIP